MPDRSKDNMRKQSKQRHPLRKSHLETAAMRRSYSVESRRQKLMRK